MAIAFVASYSGQNKSSGTAGPPPTTTLNVVTGNTYFAFVTYDSLTATTPVVTNFNISAAFAPWAQVASFDSPQSAAAGGVRGELWRLDAINNYTYSAGSTSMFTLSAAVTAKAFVVLEFTGVGTVDSVASSSGTGITDTAATGQLMLAFNGTEAASQGSFSGTAGYGFSTPVQLGTTGGSAVTNVWASGIWVVSGNVFTPTISATVTDGGLIFGVWNAASTGPQTFAVSGTVPVSTVAIGSPTRVPVVPKP